MLDKVNFKYSLKNVPIPNPTTHLRGVINSTEKFLQAARWKCYFFLNPNDKPPKNYYGFKTPKNAKAIPELLQFEKDLNNLIASLEYSHFQSDFQKQLSKDVKFINSSNKVFVSADKTTNLYQMSPEQYKTLLENNITSNYKKADPKTEDEICKASRRLTADLKIDDRVEITAKKEAYVTVKDHKSGFPHDIKCRLINPCKSNIGKITKQILDKTNAQIKIQLGLNQLINTASTIEWFDRIENKSQKQLIQLDIVNYYPSINKTLFEKAIKFAEETVPLTKIEKDLLYNARESLLYHDGQAWEKTTGLFDVTMGSFDGAQITDLVGLLILDTLKKEVPEISFALYRDDGIGAHNKLRPQKLDKIRKKLKDIFTSLELDITIETGLHKMDFLDVTFDLMTGTYAPYRKPNDTPTYVHTESNHPAHVIKNIPLAVNKRLCSISSNKEIFDDSKYPYQEALNKSAYKFNLKYEKPTPRYGNTTDTTSDTIAPTPTPTPNHQPPPDTEPTNPPTPSPTTQTDLRRGDPDHITTHQPTVNNTVPGPRRSQRIRNRNLTQHHDPVHPAPNPSPEPPPSQPPTEPEPNPIQPQQQHKKSRKRNRNILWFNPPYNRALKTKLGKEFLKLIDKNFPKNHVLYPVMNRQKVKISFATSPNMQSIINKHNQKLLRKTKTKEPIKDCNCRQLPCPIPDGKCQTKCVIYKAEINNAQYIGLSKNSIKERITSHRQTFREEPKRNSTTLSAHVWTKELNKNEEGEIIEPSIKWSIVKECQLYEPGHKTCDLCLSEKVQLVKECSNPKNINRRSDIANKCIHKKMYYYSAVT